MSAAPELQPYIGPRSFGRDERQRFFGRDRESEDLLSLVLAHSVVLVYGASGAGKSSLLNAGLIPRLEDEEFHVLGSARVAGPLPADAGRIANRYLFQALRRWNTEHASLGLSLQGLAGMTLQDFLQRLDQRCPGKARTLIFDQFEEFFICHVDKGDQRRAFIGQIAAALRSGQRLRIVFAMREEYVVQFEPFVYQLPDKLRTRMRLEQLRAREAMDAIRKPVEALDLEFERGENDPAEALVTELRKIHVDSGPNGPGEVIGEFVEPLQLQVVCQNIWRNLPPEVKAYAAERQRLPPEIKREKKIITRAQVRIEDVDDALSQHYDRAIAAAVDLSGVSEGELRRWFSDCLISSAGTRRIALAEDKSTERLPEAVLEVLKEQRVIRVETRGGSVWYELTHDRFIEPVQTSNRAWFERRAPAEALRCKLESKAVVAGARLDEVELREAEQFLQTPEAALLGTTDAVKAFVKASRERVNEDNMRKERELKDALNRALYATLFALVAIVLGAFAWQQAIAAKKAQKVAEEALTKSFVRTIGVSRDDSPSADERAALWELSELAIANHQNVRKKVIESWVWEADYMIRALAHDSRGLHAAIGLNATLANEEADGVAKALENPKEMDPVRLSRLGDALAALAAHMNPKDAASMADGVAKALENPKEMDPVRLSRLGDALAALAARMNPKDAASMADAVAKALENPKEMDPVRLLRLGDALAALAAHMNPKDAASMADAVAKALENSKEMDPVRLSRLGDALAALAAHMEPNAAASVAARGAAVLAKALENPPETNPIRLFSLSKALAALAARMEPNAAASVADGLAKALENPPETNPNRLFSLADALAALAARMEPNAAASVADGLAKALENPPETNPNRLFSLAKALAALAARMEPNAAASVADGLAKALENPQETNPNRLFSLADALAALAARMEPNAAASVAARGAAVLAKALENPQETDSVRLSRLADALAALAARMNPDAAASVADGLAKALENPQETNPNRLFSLGKALAVLAARINPDAAASVADGLAKVLKEPQIANPDRLWSLGDALAALAARMNPDAAASVADGLAKALENPQETNPNRLFSLGKALAALAARMNPDAAASVADSLAKALENPQETNPDRLFSLGKALAALAARMESNAAASVAARGAAVLAKALENPQETDSVRLSRLADALAALAARMNPDAAASVADGLAKALENPQETNPSRLGSLGSALSALAERMNPNDAASVTARGASVLAKALENPKETDPSRLGSLGSALSALAARMNPSDAASVAARGASVLAKALENPQETDASSLRSLGSALSALAGQISSARKTQLVALSNLFLGNVPGPPKDKDGKGREDEAQDRTIIARICGSLNAEELAGVLKWPFCVGEAQKLVFAELEKKTKEKIGRTFDGNVWKFVEQVDSLGIDGIDRKFLDQPATRPKSN